MALAVAGAAGLLLSWRVVFDAIGRLRRARRLVPTRGLPQEENFAVLFGSTTPHAAQSGRRSMLELLEQQRT
jgi:uncharacterized membrane protein SpoIIM required for sporulation